MKVAVVAGGLAHERDVSIRSGRRIAQTLRDEGFNVAEFDLDRTLIAHLKEFGPDVVWPLVHGSEGEDGSLQDLLTLLGYPFVGAAGASARLAHHKPSTKAVVSALGLHTPNSVTLTQGLFRQVGAGTVLAAVTDGLGLPAVVKPAAGGSALGVTIVHDASELPDAMVTCFSYSDEALIETYTAGTDIAASVVDLGDGPRVLPLVEIVTDGEYDFDARYNPGRSEYFVPSRLSAETAEKVSALAAQVHSELGMGELSRVDLIVDDAGTPWVVDVNVAPGMTEMSLFPQAAGSEASSLFAEIVRAAASSS